MERDSCQGKHSIRKETFPEPSTCIKIIFHVFLNYIHKYLYQYYSTALVFFGNSNCVLDFLCLTWFLSFVLNYFYLFVGVFNF